MARAIGKNNKLTRARGGWGKESGGGERERGRSHWSDKDTTSILLTLSLIFPRCVKWTMVNL